MNRNLFSLSTVMIAAALVAAQAVTAQAALCGKCRDLMFTDSVGHCIDCGGPTASAALQLCPKCSAKRHQCEHCLAKLTEKEEAEAEAAAVAPPPEQPAHSESNYQPQSAGSAPGNSDSGARNESGSAPAELPPPSSPDLPPPVMAPPLKPAATPGESAAQPKLKPIHPAKPGTYTAGKWRFQMQINGAGTRSEGRWGWLTYDGQKLPRGNVNDYYATPWGPMYWVDVPKNAWGLHGFMPVPSPQNPRQGRELTLPASLVATAPTQQAPAAASSPPPGPAAPKVQTLEINHSHNGQLARLHVGNVLIIRLPGNSASGYEWEVGTSNTKAVRLTVRPQYSPPKVTGSGGSVAGTYTFVYEAAEAGAGPLRFYYVRPNDTSHPRDAFAVSVNVSADAGTASARARPTESR